MVEIQSNAFYTRQDLAELLRPMGINPDSFVARIRPVKRFRLAWWGADLIAAVDDAPALNAAGQPSNKIANRGHLANSQSSIRAARRPKTETEAMAQPLRQLRDEARR